MGQSGVEPQTEALTFNQIKVGDLFKVTEVSIKRTRATRMRGVTFQKVNSTHAEIVRGSEMVGESRRFKPGYEVEITQ